jgi:hypothetical protein
MRFLHFHLLFFPLFLAGFLACSSHRDARSAQEFVERYSEAWRSEDVDAILAMRSRGKPVNSWLRQDTLHSSQESSISEENQDIEHSVRHKDFSYVSWSSTEYVSEQDHQDHLHVSVRVAGVPSSIVLVREEGMLKIHPNPSSFT